MIPLIKSTFFNEEKTKENLCNFIIGAKQLSVGSKCLEFEESFSRYQGRGYSVLFNSGSSANLALVQALLNLGKINIGDKVAFSAVTWATNVMPIIQLGLKPVPIDVELETLNVSSRTLLEALSESSDIKVMFLTHLLGFCSDVLRIRELCEQKNIILLEDNCESLGTVIEGKRLGNFGLGSTFSFYVGHHFSSIEGGVVCTDDADLAVMLKMVRAHGWDRNLKIEERRVIREKHGIVGDFYANYTFYTLGFNLRPTEITGFLGIEQLKYSDEILSRRNENFLKFNEAAKLSFDFFPLKTDHIQFVSNFAYPLIVKSEESFRRYLAIFKGRGVEIRPIVGGNITDQPFFKKIVGGNYNLPNSSIIHRQGFYFGNNPDLTEQEIEIINHAISGNDNSVNVCDQRQSYLSSSYSYLRP